MTIKLTADQIEFQNSLRRFFETEVAVEYLKKRSENPESDPKLWEKVSEFGLLSFFQDESSSLTELSLIAFESGRVLFPENLLEAILFGPYFYTKFLNQAERTALRQDTAKLLLDPLPRMTAPIDINNNTETCIPVNLHTQYYAVSDALGVKIHSFAQTSARKLNSADFSRSYYSVRTQLNAGEVLSTRDFTPTIRALRSMEIAGMLSRIVEMTKEFLVTRTQFDVPVGGFQAVQHRMADIYLQTESLRALANFATWSLQYSPEQAALAAQAAITYACEIAPLVIEAAIQLHGGIGFTWEYPLHLYLRRIKTLELALMPKERDYLELLARIE